VYYLCAPTSAHQLKIYAENIRNIFNCKSLNFPIIDVLEIMQNNENFLGFEYQVINDNDDLFSKDELAKFDFNSNVLYIRESQYNAACDGEPRSRFTLTHELSHFFLMVVTGRHPKECDEKPPVYKDPEWQANALAGYILIPPKLTSSLGVEEIERECGVSPECATYAVLKRTRENHKN